MITVIVGPNTFLAHQKLQDIKEKFITQYSDLALEQFDCEEVGLQPIKAALESVPFLSTRKLVVLRSPSALKEFKEDYQEVLDRAEETTDILIYEPKPDKRTSYYKFLKKQSEFFEFADPDERSLAQWLTEEVSRRKGRLTRSDAMYLIDRIGTNQNMLSSELDKLLSYQADISRDTINILTEPTPKSTVFELLDAAFTGNREQVVKLYEQQRQLKVEPQQIIAMLAWQLHVLVVLAAGARKSDADIAKQARINPYVVRKSRNLLHHVSASRLKQLISELVDLDYKGKTRPIDVDGSLQAFLLAISQE